MNANGRRLVYVAGHAVGAAAFFFVLQHVVLKQTLDSSLLWSAFFAGAAALVAWRQASA